MSSFQDNFKRDSEEDQLEYDDSAFYYFSLAVLTFFLMPYTYYLLKTFFFGAIDLQTEGVNCETAWFQNLLKSKKVEARKSIWTRSFMFRIICGAFLWYLWYLNFSMVSSIEGLQSFDPYQILEIPLDAELKDIRKKYRQLSLIKHPDKNPDNPLAVAEFIRLTKAYNVTTHCFIIFSLDPH
jgi:translocation protein SEC63